MNVATLKGLRHVYRRHIAQPFQGCEEIKWGPCTQGFKANPGLKLANAFSVKLGKQSVP